MATRKLIGTDPDQVSLNSDLGTLAFQDSDGAVINKFTQYTSTGLRESTFENGNLSLASTGTSLHNYYGPSGLAGLSRTVISISDNINPDPIYYENKEGKFIGQSFSSMNDQGYNQGAWLGSVSESSRDQGFLRTPSFVFGQRIGNSNYEAMRIDSKRNVVIGSDDGYARLQVLGNFISFNDNVVGSEKVSNGAFVSNSGWTLGTGWEYDSANQRMYHNSNNAGQISLIPYNLYNGYYSGDLSQNVSAVANEFYKLTFTISGLTEQYNGYKSGFVDIFLGGVNSRRVNANGTFTKYIKAINNTNLIFRPSSTFNGYIDNVSVTKILGGNIEAHGLFTGGGTEGIKIDSTGQLGIGTNSPSARLHINVSSADIYEPASAPANPTLSDVLLLENTDNTTNGYVGIYFRHKNSGVAWGRIALQGNFFGAPQHAFVYTMRGASGLTNNEKFRIGNTGNISFNGDTNSYIGGGSSIINFTTASSERMRIDAAGNVGIGTSTPIGKLDVRGIAHFNYNGTSNIGLTTIDAFSSASRIIQYNASGIPTNALVTSGDSYINGGNVGIGTSTPGRLLDVAGQARISSVLTMGSYIQGTTQLDLYGDATSSLGVRITSTGNVGIGTASPSAKFHITETWNNAATTFTHIKSNVTDTASAAGSLLMDLQVGGASKFSVGKGYGSASISGNAITLTNVGGFNSVIRHEGNESLHFVEYSQNVLFLSGIDFTPSVQVPSNKTFGWSSSTSQTQGDLVLHRDAANTLAQRNGINAQTSRIYNTYTDASNYERAKIGWNGGILEIGQEYAGTGLPRNINIKFGTNTVYLNNGASNNTPVMAISGASSKAAGFIAGTNGSGFIFDNSGPFAISMDSKAAITSGSSNGGTVLLTIDTSGNVGIGTNSPGSKLQVNGALRVVNNTLGQGLQFAVNDGGGYPVLNLSRTDNSGTVFISTPSGISFTGGPTTLSNNLFIGSDQGIYGNGVSSLTLGSGEGSFLRLGVKPANVFTEVIRITNGTNVGIGTTNPTQKLHVVGTAKIADKLIQSGSVSLSTVQGSFVRIYQFVSDLNNGACEFQLKIIGAGYSHTTDTYIVHMNYDDLGAAIGSISRLLPISGTQRRGTTTTGWASGDFAIEIERLADTTWGIRCRQVGVTDQTSVQGINFTIEGSFFSGNTLNVSGTDTSNYAYPIFRNTPIVAGRGRVGINTVNPAYTLDVTGTGNFSTALYTPTVYGPNSALVMGGSETVINTSTGKFYIGNSGQTASYGGGHAYIEGNNSTYFAIGVSNSEKLRIDTAGNVGIGTSTTNLGGWTGIGKTLSIYSPSSPGTLELSSTNVENNTPAGRILFTQQSFGSTQAASIDAVREIGNGQLALRFTAGGSEAVRIRINGNVGIGTTAPSAKLDIAETWNNVATTFTHIKSNVTDTASAAGSFLMDLQVGGSSRATVTKAGKIIGVDFEQTLGGSGFYTNGISSYANYFNAYSINAGGIVSRSQIVLADSNGNNGVFLQYDGVANTLAQRNGIIAQTSRIYNTHTDASNYERAKIGWNTNVLEIGTENAGTGTLRSVNIIGSSTTITSNSASTALTVRQNGAGNLLELRNSSTALHEFTGSGDFNSVVINLRNTAGGNEVHQTYRPDLNYIGVMSDHNLVWRSVSTGSFFSAGSIDTGIGRNQAGVVEVNNGTSGTLRDIRVRTLQVENVNQTSEATTLATVTKTQVASFPAASFRSGKLIIQAYDSVTGQVQISELLVAHNGTTASATEYGVVFTGTTSMVVYDVDISAGNVRLLATRTTANSTQYKTSETLMIA